MKQKFCNIRRMSGITLMEVISSLAIIGVVIGGALALYGSASSSQQSNQMMSDLTAVRSSIKQLYQGQGTYGAGTDLNPVLINSKRVPATMSVSAATITHGLNGTLTATGATSAFTVAIANIPTDVCTLLLAGSTTGWTSVQVDAQAANTSFPISPVAASTQCAVAPSATITFTGT